MSKDTLFEDMPDGAVTIEELQRLKAAWNACLNIPTEALEAGVVADLLEAAKAVVEKFWIDELRPRHIRIIEKALVKAEGKL